MVEFADLSVGKFNNVVVNELLVINARQFVNIQKSNKNYHLLSTLQSQFGIYSLSRPHLNKRIHRKPTLLDFLKRYFIKKDIEFNKFTMLQAFECPKCKNTVESHLVVTYLTKHQQLNINKDRIHTKFSCIACPETDYITILNGSKIGIFTREKLMSYLKLNNFQYVPKIDPKDIDEDELIQKQKEVCSHMSMKNAFMLEHFSRQISKPYHNEDTFNNSPF